MNKNFAGNICVEKSPCVEKNLINDTIINSSKSLRNDALMFIYKIM